MNTHSWTELHRAFSPRVVAEAIGITPHGRCVEDIDRWRFCEMCGNDLSETQVAGKFLGDSGGHLVAVHRQCPNGHPGFYGFRITPRSEPDAARG